MTKELEALREIYNGMYNKQGFVKEFKAIERALTPPTADDVCKALSEYFGFSFYYQDNFFYRSDGIKYIYPLKVSGFTEIQLYDGHLPPHLITLIGRFYEGVRK